MPFTATAPIETERLRVRLVTESDLPALLEVNGDEEVNRYLPSTPWRSFAEAEAWFKRVTALMATGKGLLFVVATRETDRAIGTCALFGLEEENAHAELGYVLGRSHWGQGLMREALTDLITCIFQTMTVRRLEAQLDSRNTTSSSLLRRLGFTRDGVLRQRWTTRGEISDVEIHSLLRQEWPGVVD